MTNIKIIDSIIDDSNLFDNQNYIIEKDNDKRGESFEMEFRIIKSNGIEYKLYRFEKKDFPFFKDVAGLKKMCDFILFAEEKNHLHIFLIELKLSPDSAKKQLDAASEFAHFLLKSSKRIGKEITNFSIKKIRICQKVVNKRKKLALENNFEFDKNDFLDYKLNTIHLSNLMQY